MKKLLILLALFIGLNVYPEITDTAAFQSPYGTQISLFGERHMSPGLKDEEQVSTLLASIRNSGDNSDRPLHIMIEEPSSWIKKAQTYPTVPSTLRTRLLLGKNKDMKVRLILGKNKKITAENAEVRCAAGAARYILYGANPDPEHKWNAKELFGSRKLNKWQSVRDVTFNDLYAEFEEAFNRLEKVRPVDDLRAMLAEFKQAYPLYGDDSIYLATRGFDETMQDQVGSRIKRISDQILEYYLLTRALAKSKKKDVLIIAGAKHTGTLRGLLQHEACALVDFKYPFDGKLTFELHEFSRIKTIYLKFLRYYIELKRIIGAKTKSLKFCFNNS